jgi:hypothetical protein
MERTEAYNVVAESSEHTAEYSGRFIPHGRCRHAVPGIPIGEYLRAATAAYTSSSA